MVQHPSRTQQHHCRPRAAQSIQRVGRAPVLRWGPDGRLPVAVLDFGCGSNSYLLKGLRRGFRIRLPNLAVERVDVPIGHRREVQLQSGALDGRVGGVGLVGGDGGADMRGHGGAGRRGYGGDGRRGHVRGGRRGHGFGVVEDGCEGKV